MFGLKILKIFGRVVIVLQLSLAPEANDIPLNCSLAWKRLSASPPVAPMMLSPREAMISMSPGRSLLTLTNSKC